MPRNKITGLFLIFGLLLSISSYDIHSVIAKEKPSKPAPIKIDKLVPVRVMKVRSENLPLIVESVGRLYANRRVTVSAQLPGIIAGYAADVGDRVDAGQVLVLIDPVDYQLALDEARANLAAVQAQLDSAEKALDRCKDLLPRKVITSDYYEKAENACKAARAQSDRAKVGVRIAEERMKKTRLTAPFPGLVSERHIEVGQMVGTGVPLLTLVDLDPIRARIFLTEKDYVHLDRHDPVRIRVEAYPDHIFKGRIDRIGITADARTNTFAVEILADNHDMILKAGLSVRVYVTTRVLKNVILIPQKGVLYKDKGTDVFILGKGDRAEVRSVKLGQTKGALVRVLDGLKPGDELIIQGQHYLKSGDRIRVSRDTK